MPHNPIPPANADLPEEGGAPRPVDWEQLESLAADELAPEAAATVRARIASDARWRAAFVRVEAVHRALVDTAMFSTPADLLQQVMDQIPGASPAQAATRAPLRLLRWPQLAAGWAAAVLLSLAGWAALAHATPAHADGTHNVTLVAALKMVPTGLGDERANVPAIPALLAHANDAHATDAGNDRGLAAAWPWLLGGLLLVSGGTAAALGAHRRALEGVA